MVNLCQPQRSCLFCQLKSHSHKHWGSVYPMDPKDFQDQFDIRHIYSNPNKIGKNILGLRKKDVSPYCVCVGGGEGIGSRDESVFLAE